MAITRAGAPSAFSPISCTLIHGDREAVLVDTPISKSQTQALITWIEGIMPNKELTYVYITHGHGDHWFGIPLLKERWPNLKAIATKATVEQMKIHLKLEYFNELWLNLFPGDQIYQPQQLAEALEKDTFTIEGHEFRVIQVGHTDTVDTTVLHVPDLSLVVAGDAVYGDVHQYFGEADTTEKRKEWLAALDTIESLKPHTVVAGHKRAGSVDGLYNVQATREYIEAFDQATRTCKSAEELYGKIQELYPNRINPHAILRGAAAAFPQSTKL
tara:strand:- start:2221 stop:3036 length:816 start_codon:yes stop_codon:yes gene_type:complete